MKVVEKFVSINGEGKRAGELAVFIRFFGCNLNCSYCDTKWAKESGCPYEEMSAGQIVDYVKDTGVKNVTLTGGEPLLQQGIDSLIEVLEKIPEIRIEIETNGSIILPSDRVSSKVCFTMDYKLAGSGCEEQMQLDNFMYLRAQDTVKFVVSSGADLERAEEVIRQYQLCEICQVYLSPVFGAIAPADIVEYMKEKGMNDVRLQLQIHKLIWNPKKRGV